MSNINDAIVYQFCFQAKPISQVVCKKEENEVKVLIAQTLMTSYLIQDYKD